MKSHLIPVAPRDISVQELLHLQEEERARISRELHDGIGQMLAVLQKDLTALSRTPAEAPGVRDSFKEAAKQVQQILDEVRRITLSLMPAILEDLGLDGALRTLFHECTSRGIRVSADLPPLGNLMPAEQQIHFYRIFQEIFSNILQHSHASEATLQVCHKDGMVHCVVTDNGIGFLPETQQTTSSGKHCGIRNMLARAELLEGSLSIAPGPVTGTVVVLTVPIEERRARASHASQTTTSSRRKIL